jgi:hypothetical protein
MSNRFQTYEEQEESFVQSCDTYAIYEALDVVDRIEDISIRINVRENDLGEIEEAVEEIVRLARQARNLLETVTGDFPEEHEYWAEPDSEEESRDE